MSVIAKMYVAKSGTVPSGALIHLSCVYDSDLSKDENEDIRFTKASPWGEASFELKQGLAEGSCWYLLFDEEPDEGGFDKCDFALKVRCHVVHDYGQSKQVEISTAYDQVGIPEYKKTSGSKTPPFHLKMTIDNPGASIQFVPNKVYYLRLFFAGKFENMHEAMAYARS